MRVKHQQIINSITTLSDKYELFMNATLKFYGENFHIILKLYLKKYHKIEKLLDNILQFSFSIEHDS